MVVSCGALRRMKSAPRDSQRHTRSNIRFSHEAAVLGRSSYHASIHCVARRSPVIATPTLATHATHEVGSMPALIITALFLRVCRLKRQLSAMPFHAARWRRLFTSRTVTPFAAAICALLCVVFDARRRVICSIRESYRSSARRAQQSGAMIFPPACPPFCPPRRPTRSSPQQNAQRQEPANIPQRGHAITLRESQMQMRIRSRGVKTKRGADKNSRH